MPRKPYQYPDGVGREPDATIMDYHRRENMMDITHRDDLKKKINRD